MLRALGSLAWGIALLGLLSCQTVPTSSLTESSADDQLLPDGKDRFALIYLGGRRAAVETCGCTFIPRGGIAREWQQRRLWDSQNIPTLTLQADSTFLPSSFVSENVPYYRNKATLIARVMAEMAVDVFSPAYQDLTLGQTQTREWEKASKSHWISANLYDRSTKQTLFASSYQTRVAKQAVRVFGVSSCRLGRDYRAEASVECRPVVDSLRKALAEQAPQPGVLDVLIGSVTPAERETIRREFPRLRIVFNSDEQHYVEYTEQEDVSHLYVNPIERGMQLVRMVFAGSANAPTFYSELKASAAYDRIEDLKIKMLGVDVNLRNRHLRAPIRKLLLEEKAGYARDMANARVVAETRREGSLSYYAETASLTNSLEPSAAEVAQNPMQRALEKFRIDNHDFLQASGAIEE